MTEVDTSGYVAGWNPDAGVSRMPTRGCEFPDLSLFAQGFVECELRERGIPFGALEPEALDTMLGLCRGAVKPAGQCEPTREAGVAFWAGRQSKAA